MKDILSFYKNKKVFVTGHTGFKGSWICKILTMAGAEVTGYSLPAPTSPSLFEVANIERGINSFIGDICDYATLKRTFDTAEPDIVFHLAAQPIVKVGYENPYQTYYTNVMGTVNILECVRTSSCVKSFLNITTDKVYLNKEHEWGYRENEELDGYDPYSNSKSCSELITHCYQRSFFDNRDKCVRIPISTARAGNIIGGGDFASYRIIPDCVRACINGEDIELRNPHSIRPYQHVLDAIFAYLMVAASQYEDSGCSGAYNVGPDESECCETKRLVDLFVSMWGGHSKAVNFTHDFPHEACFLRLDCSKIKHTYGWQPHWNIETTVEKTVEWYKIWCSGGDVNLCMERQINDFIYDV